MTRRATIASRLLAVAAALTLVVGVGAGASSLTGTQAAWNDKTFTSAAVTAGDWAAPTSTGCVVMNMDGTPMKGGTCKVNGIVFDQWGDDATTHHRAYYVSVTSNSAGGYIQMTLDLNQATLRNNSGTGTWKWGNAATTGGHITPTSTCAALPALTGNSPQSWNWGDFYFSMVDNKNAVSPGTVTCR